MGDNALPRTRRSSRIRHTTEQGAENELLGFITQTPQPSEKALGKRPQQIPVIHNAATLPDDNHGSRKATRILPSRTSRKSQGTLMVDELLLDYEQRSAAAKTSMPSTTPFLLTTDASLVPQPQQTEHGLTNGGQPQSRSHGVPATSASAQEPDFIQLTAASAVGSRLRVRETDDTVSDTSDQAYLARHRRFEALEKRQRLREKEKIQHERYKLKERIEQLRAIPAQAFLKNQPSALLTGEQLAQGERTRRELLREAEELERRYDLLLSKDREHQAEDIRPPSLTIKVRLGSLGTRTPPADGRPNAVTFATSHHPTGVAHQLMSSVRNPIGRSVARWKGISRSSSPEQSRTAHNKRARYSAPSETLSYAEIESHAPFGYVPNILRVAAPTNASRTTGRASMPFGVKAPPILEDQNDFELPPDILGDRTSVPSNGGPPESEDHPAEEDAGPSEDETLGLLALDDDEY